MKVLSKVISLAVVLQMMLFITGCSQEDIYEHAKNYEENTKQKLEEMADAPVQENIDASLENMERKMDEAAASSTKALSDGSKAAGIWIIIGSILIGVLMAIITYKTSAIKLLRFAIMVFILGIPILTIVAIYGLAFLASWFM